MKKGNTYNMKRLFTMILALVMGITLSACSGSSGNNDGNVTGTLEEIMERLYADIPQDERPMMLDNMPVDSENIAYYLGTEDIDYKQALASEPGISSIAYSVVLVRMNDGADIEAAKKAIKDNVNPAKWICVEAETVKVLSKGDLILLIMTNSQIAEKLETAFNAL